MRTNTIIRRTLLFILFVWYLCSCSVAFAQKYEYAEIFSIKMGIYDKPKIIFQFTKEDSTDFYNVQKPKHIINAIELLESKGWELVTVNNAATQNNMVWAYLRRRK